MKTLEEQLAFYDAYHRNKWNIATHFIGIPVIIVSLFIPLGWIRLMEGPIPVTGALFLIVAVWVYYMALDPMFAMLMLLFIVPAGMAADRLSVLSWPVSAAWFLGLFIGGWIFQLVGHSVFEKRKPAFVDNLIQLLIGPLFLEAEILFWLGMRQPLHNAILARRL